MNYEAILLDNQRGHHARGTGGSPVLATMQAFRKVAAFELPENRREEVDKIDQTMTINGFCVCSLEDEFYSDPKTLREEVSDIKLLVRVDKTKETMYTPCGWVRPLLG